MGLQSKNACSRKEIIDTVQKIINEMDNSNVEARCCCTNLSKLPPGQKVISASCLDGARAIPRVVSDKQGRYIWIPPQVDNRPTLDPTMSCYAATVANQFYDAQTGCKLDCNDGDPHSHWWNNPQGQAAARAGQGNTSDLEYCQDPNFVPPEPLGYQSWSSEPGGTCRYPQYCKAACFDHSPARDWARHY